MRFRMAAAIFSLVSVFCAANAAKATEGVLADGGESAYRIVVADDLPIEHLEIVHLQGVLSCCIV